MKKIRLMPILERLGACEEAKSWIRFHRFDTFAEAWARCPDIMWIDWLVEELSNQGGGTAWSDEAYAAFEKGTKVYSAASRKAWDAGRGEPGAHTEALDALRAYWDPYREKVTEWLLIYRWEQLRGVVDNAAPTEGEDDASTAADT